VIEGLEQSSKAESGDEPEDQPEDQVEVGLGRDRSGRLCRGIDHLDRDRLPHLRLQILHGADQGM
jgi:hypothetical protein